MKLIVLVGPPGSGKSSYCDAIRKYDNTQLLTRISQDDRGKAHLIDFHDAIKKGEDIIIDRMGFSKEQRNRYIKPAKEAGYHLEIVVFHVPRQVCFDRMMKRENHPTINGKMLIDGAHEIISPGHKTHQANSALDTFFTKYERVEDNEADKVTRFGHDGPKTTAIICDLDGTLCNIDHRLKHVKNENKKLNRWDLFNKEIPNDSLNEWCNKLINRMGSSVYDIVLCSGRVDSSRQDTEKWLTRFNVQYDHLLMRHRSDFRTDYIIKEIILDFEILTRYNVLFAIDDRKQVVDMWRRRGIVCLACADGDF